jgi:hypothetical protein
MKQHNFSHHHIPELPETLILQVSYLATGHIPVVMFPPNTPKDHVPALPDTMYKTYVFGPGEGLYYYNPTQISEDIIRIAAEDGTHGTLLGHVQDIEEAFLGWPIVIQAKQDLSHAPIQDSVVDGDNPDMINAQVASFNTRFPDAYIYISSYQTVLADRNWSLFRTLPPRTVCSPTEQRM